MIDQSPTTINLRGQRATSKSDTRKEQSGPGLRSDHEHREHRNRIVPPSSSVLRLLRPRPRRRRTRGAPLLRRNEGPLAVLARGGALRAVRGLLFPQDRPLPVFEEGALRRRLALQHAALEEALRLADEQL